MKMCMSKHEGESAEEHAEHDKGHEEPLLSQKTKTHDEMKEMTTKEKKEAKKMKALKEIQKAKKSQVKSAVEDPLSTFGIGIVSYRNTLFELFVLFAFLALISYPMKTAFMGGNAISSQVSTIYGRESISNLGYASIQCQNVPYGLGKVVLQCPYGYLGEVLPKSIGATPSTLVVKDACQVNVENKKCSDQIDAAKIQK